MKNRYKALGVPKTPVFILQTTKIRPRKPRKHVAREMMSRNAGLRTRGCNVSTEHSPSLKDSAASGVPQANTIRNDFIARSAKRHRLIAVSGAPRRPSNAELNP